MIPVSRRAVFLAVVLLALSTASAITQTSPLTWPEAVAPLSSGKTMAEACVGLLKRFGNESQIANGQFTYAKAKSDSDAVIDGLVTVLAMKGTLAGLPSLQSRLSASLAELEQLCNSVKSLLPASPPTGEKAGVFDALSIIKEAIGPILTGALNGIATLYNDHRADDALTRKSIQQQLESSRWPDFAKVSVQ
jgi:hypothetical protein